MLLLIYIKQSNACGHSLPYLENPRFALKQRDKGREITRGEKAYISIGMSKLDRVGNGIEGVVFCVSLGSEKINEMD